MSPLHRFLLLSAVLFTNFATAALPDNSLITNGDFEKDANSDHWPDDWGRLKNGGSWQEEGGNHFLRLVSGMPGETVLLYRAVPLPKDVKMLELSWRWRVTDLQPGKQPWFDARIMMEFRDAADQKMSGSPGAPALRKSSNGWVEGTTRFAVPEGARTLALMPTLFQVERGTFDLDDVALKPLDPATLDTAAAAELKSREPAVEAPQRSRWPAELHVAGRDVLTKEGKSVWLQGVNVVSLEFSQKGERVLRSTQVAVEDWKSNIIRLPVKDDFWFGRGGGQKDGGAAYRALVDAVITIAANRGAYVLLDLHKFRAPMPEHVIFWKDAAARYKDHPAVLFDLFNEPHGVSWEIWRNGGFVPEKEKPADEDAFTSAADKAKAAKGFQSPGMQGLVDAVRSTGAHNVVLAGGLDWAYDLSGIANGYALEDKSGNGIIYSTHIYPWKRDWAGKVLVVAEKHPVLIGELGADVKKMSFIPAEAQEDPSTWVPDMLGLIQKHRLHWTAFSFHPKATPVLITGWDYTPTPFWGAPAKRALGGEKFELKKLR